MGTAELSSPATFLTDRGDPVSPQTAFFTRWEGSFWLEEGVEGDEEEGASESGSFNLSDLE